MAEIKTNAMRILEKTGCAYQMHTYDPGDGIDGVSVAKKTGQDPAKVYKTLVTAGKSGQHYVFVLPVAEELDLKKAAKAVREKSVEMIPVKEINKVTGYIRGGCSPVGMKKLFPTVIADTALGLESFLVSGGRIGLQIEADPRALAQVVGASFADILL